MRKFGTEDFSRFSSLIYNRFGICYNNTKRDILQTKLNKLMSKYNMDSYSECYEYLIKAVNKTFLNDFANEITVNYTSFFRESPHFDVVKEHAARLLKDGAGRQTGRELRIWSAACSTGEEPYTLAMVLQEMLPTRFSYRILATDISKKVLAIAQQGLYSSDIKNEVGRLYLQKYFCETPTGYAISEDIRNLVFFRQFNLMDDFPFQNTFDIVFCRNVMIYFDAAVRQDLARKFYEILNPGGMLFIGHSESLSGYLHNFRYVQPAVYAKI